VVMGIVWLIVCGCIAAFCWWATYHVFRADQAGLFKSRGSTPYVGMTLFIVSGIVSTCFAIAKPMAYLYEVCAPGLTLFDHLMTTSR
jgi:ABC-type multidrug transport system permease subunit